jgi:hypothetical protein
LSPREHAELLCSFLGPVAESAVWRDAAAWLVLERGVLPYVATHGAEGQNLSVWNSWLNVRAGEYPAGREVVAGLYVAHEVMHAVTSDESVLSRDGFAAAFHRSERLASYESEIGVYADLPGLEDVVPWDPLLAGWLRRRGWDLADQGMVMEWRDRMIVDPSQDPVFVAELPSEAARLSSYRDNVPWALSQWDRLDAVGWWDFWAAQTVPVAVSPWESWRAPEAAGGVSGAWGRLDDPVAVTRWRELVVRSVRSAFVLSGCAGPLPVSFEEAVLSSPRLDGCELIPELSSVASQVPSSAQAPPAGLMSEGVRL